MNDSDVIQAPARDSNGRWLEQHPAGKATQFTPETARIAQAQRWENYRRNAAQAIAEKYAKITGLATGHGATPGAAWGFVVARQYGTLLASDKPRGDDLYRLGQIVGALPRSGELQAQAQADAPAHSADAAALMVAEIAARVLDLARTLAQSAPQDTVDGTVTDVSSG